METKFHDDLVLYDNYMNVCVRIYKSVYSCANVGHIRLAARQATDRTNEQTNELTKERTHEQPNGLTTLWRIHNRTHAGPLATMDGFVQQHVR